MIHPEITTRFGLIRHAETVWNRAKRIQGHQDSPLTPEGELQAAAWGRTLQRLRWERILASDTGRAVATAERINNHLGLPVVLDRRLRHGERENLRGARPYVGDQHHAGYRNQIDELDLCGDIRDIDDIYGDGDACG